MNHKLDTMAFGLSGGMIAAACMLLLGVLGNLGIYEGAVEMMAQWHMFFSLSPAGIVAGMIEAFVISFVILVAGAFVYNRLTER